MRVVGGTSTLSVPWVTSGWINEIGYEKDNVLSKAFDDLVTVFEDVEYYVRGCRQREG